MLSLNTPANFDTNMEDAFIIASASFIYFHFRFQQVFIRLLSTQWYAETSHTSGKILTKATK